MEITCFLRKYIDLMLYDKPHNSVPVIFLIAIFVFVQTNVIMVVLIDAENLERTLLLVADIVMTSMLLCNLIKRNLDNQEAFKLLDLIEDDFAVSRHELEGRYELWIKLDTFYEKKRKYMRAMSKNLAVIFSVCFLLLNNRNVLNKLSGLTSDSENESITWPTPYLTYCPPELKSPIFFIYTYVLQSLMVVILVTETFFVITVVCLSTEKILADFDTLHTLLEDIMYVYPDLNPNNSDELQANQLTRHSSYIEKNLRKDMAFIALCHQRLNRNFKICADGSGFMILMIIMVIMIHCCTMAYLMMTIDDLKKKLNFVILFILVNMAVFFPYHNGQRIFNQNDILRRTLADLPWTDKPQWFKQTLLIMITRANVDTVMRPYGIHTLNYQSFKDLMKTAFSIGNVLYTKKLTS